jgi:predicted TIM-barrel fold metal-dependent hydrolase
MTWKAAEQRAIQTLNHNDTEPFMQGKIAVEEHFVTPELEDTIFGSIGWDPEEWRRMADLLQETDAVRIAEMDRFGIEMSVLSLAAPCIQDIVDTGAAIAAAQGANDALAEVVAAHPDRYAAFAALPMQSPEAAADELERVVRTYGFKGGLVNGYSSIGNLETAAYYDEPQYEVFWHRAAGLGVPLYLHPRNPLPNQRRMYEGREELLGPTWAFTVETATHSLRLITSGLFDRHPDLTVIIGHMGELLPFALDRTRQRLSRIPGVSLERPATEYLRHNFFLTTSGNFHSQSLTGALLQVGSDRLLFAVDYPFEETADAVTWFDHVPISELDRQKIGRDNAKTLLGL